LKVFKNFKLLVLAVLTAGAVLGQVAAAGKLDEKEKVKFSFASSGTPER